MNNMYEYTPQYSELSTLVSPLHKLSYCVKYLETLIVLFYIFV